ncbi:MAG: septum formation initiator family protein [Candidatus Buchananbacteria bacterium]|jgi:cell division protein FtsB
MNKIFKTDQAIVANRLWFLAGLIIFLLLFFGLTKEIVNRRQISRQIGDYKEKIAQLRAENSVLSDKVSNWDKSGELELNARVKLGLEKPGEQTIVINRPDSGSAESTAVNTNQEVIDLSGDNADSGSESNIAKWWNYFFK